MSVSLDGFVARADHDDRLARQQFHDGGLATHCRHSRDYCVPVEVRVSLDEAGKAKLGIQDAVLRLTAPETKPASASGDKKKNKKAGTANDGRARPRDHDTTTPPPSDDNDPRNDNGSTTPQKTPTAPPTESPEPTDTPEPTVTPDTSDPLPPTGGPIEAPTPAPTAAAP